MSTFGGELLRFVGELRLAEMQVSVAETLDAMRAVAAAGFADRARLREALAAALVKDEADRESFDDVFARFFGAGGGAVREAGRPAPRARRARRSAPRRRAAQRAAARETRAGSGGRQSVRRRGRRRHGGRRLPRPARGAGKRRLPSQPGWD